MGMMEASALMNGVRELGKPVEIEFPSRQEVLSGT